MRNDNLPDSIAHLQQMSPTEQLELAQAVLRTEADALSQLALDLDHSFVQATDALLATLGSVIIIGMGKAGLIGQKIVATLGSTGTPSHFVHPAEAVHGDLGRIRESDLVLLLSFSGETEEITSLLPALHERAIKTIAITASLDSTLSKQCDVVIPIGQLKEADPLGLAPSTSTTAMLAIGDALALVVSKQRHFTSHDFAKFHPAGSLGRKLTKVDDVMRPLSHCRIANDSKTVREVFVNASLPGRRTGAVMLVDNSGKLTGIFTDSDLARMLENNKESHFDGAVAQFMTANPVTALTGSLMTDAVKLLSAKRISELPVCNELNEPVGMLDITDAVAWTPPESSVSDTESDDPKVIPLRKSG